ncbi:replication initiation protein [Rhodococcus sp. RDE2]|uniref:replication initiation protein n=2 Tax=unclassified Rhodococcus (in: high G+C Gram-positive bacteria) TaxID=192944 RepID=UPI001E28756E|nr:replication initiation protein [Rhodococcus sp. RDE2]
MTPERWESEHWFGRYPLASNDPRIEGAWRMPRNEALLRRFIQMNPREYVSQIVVDIDHPDAELRAFTLHEVGLVPNLFAYSTRPGHGQAVFLLEAPVPLSDASHRKPINLLARCQQGLTVALGGDRHYAGPLGRNPLHPLANTRWCSPRPYGLRDLARGLGELLPRRPQSTRVEDCIESALGRNCWMFDTTRRWAYRAWTRYPNRSDWDEAVYAYTWSRNPELHRHPLGPLPDSELRSIAKSVSAFVWNSELRKLGPEQFEANYRRWKAECGRKGGRKGGRVVSAAKIEANRTRATKIDIKALLEADRGC